MLNRDYTIASTEDTSSEVTIDMSQAKGEWDEYGISKLICPANLRGIASLALQESWDGGATWNPVYDENGVAASVVLTAGASIPLQPTRYATLAPKTRWKANAVATGGSAVFKAIFRRI